MKSFTPHLASPPPGQREFWPHLAPLQNQGFVLYGGTALTLRLGHRESKDFDLFANQPLHRDAVRHSIPQLTSAQTIQDESHTQVLRLPLKAGTSIISLFGNIRIGRVGEPEITEANVIPVASLIDIFAMKLKVILERAESKDYLDIAAILRSGERLERGVGAAIALYPDIQAKSVLKALAFYDDGDLSTLSPDDRELLSGHARAFRDVETAHIVSQSLVVRQFARP